MLLELRNIKVNERFSEETTQFTADIYVDNKKVGYAKNDGQGGSTYYNSYGGKRVQMAAAEAYTKTLPSTVVDLGDRKFTIESDLENWIDLQVEAFLKEKDKKSFDKKVQRSCETAIVWGVPDSGKVSALGFKPKQNLVKLMGTKEGKAAVMSLIVKVRGQLKEGEVIFNKNVPHSL